MSAFDMDTKGLILDESKYLVYMSVGLGYWKMAPKNGQSPRWFFKIHKRITVLNNQRTNSDTWPQWVSKKSQKPILDDSQ
jgi:hypothetical protein